MGLSTILPGILLLGIVIFIHELGHFIVAKWRGVTVVRFSLGMGPEMVGFAHRGTRYTIGWIPLGGFVQMAGDHLNDDGSMPEGGPEQFLTHPWPGRMLIAVAGPVANLFLAYATYVVLLTTGFKVPDFANVLGTVPESSAAHATGFRSGDRFTALGGKPVGTWRQMEQAYSAADTGDGLTFAIERAETSLAVTIPGGQVRRTIAELEPPASPPLIGAIRSGLPAYLAGFRVGDFVLSVDDVPVTTFQGIRAALHGKAEREVRVRVRRAGGVVELRVKPIRDETGSDPTAGLIGVEPPVGLTWRLKLPLREAFGAAGTQTLASIATVYDGLWKSVTRFWQYREQLGGPIFIAQMASDAARRGLDDWLALLAIINLAIMSFNLLPVPLLDGGHITLALVEAVRRRAVSGRSYLTFQKVGLVVVGVLFLFIISQDILRPLRRMRALDRNPRETTTVAPSRR